MFQSTINETICVTGVGLHTGEKVRIRLSPAPENQGIKFFLNTTEEKKIFVVDPFNITDTHRATTVGSISTVEHLLAAIYWYGIDNINIDVEGNEVPIMDGSAQNFLKMLEVVGRRDQDVMRKSWSVTDKGVFNKGTRNEIQFFPGYELTLHINIDFHGQQSHFYIDRHKDKQIIGARTFCNAEDVEKMREMGLIKGGSLDNALVFKDGIPVNRERMENEPVKHKTVDVLGDFMALGRINGSFIMNNPGHTVNNEFLRFLLKEKLLICED